LAEHRPKIIAVDGPAGAGKSSICGQVCDRTGFHYVNTGALYRAVGFLAAREDLDLASEAQVTGLTAAFAAEAQWDFTSSRLLFRGEDLTDQLGTVAVGNAASHIARLEGVREGLLPLQRRLALTSSKGALLDGRDIGTVVFPDADLKIYMTASLQERARRRYSQLLANAKKVGAPTTEIDFDEIQKGIAQRDNQDSSRGTAPMKQASNAVLLDTSTMTISEAVDAIVELMRVHGLLA